MVQKRLVNPNGGLTCFHHVYLVGHTSFNADMDWSKNLGRLWLAYTELQGDFSYYNL